MAVCARCGLKNPEGFRFCGSCGAELDVARAAAREERKVISVLFCDLVGFTATAQAVDPEDVSRMLGAYHDTVRAEIERFGGSVEKFIGDAAVGVWGAPVAREDDAERAVRSALAILDVVDVEVRVAVNTGEALVKLDQSPNLGATMVGDVVNTASRLQAVAPVGCVLVGAGTVLATRDAITYEELEPVGLKGKPEPVPVWRVLGLRTQAIDRPSTPFIGRERELRLLKDVFERAVAERGVQLVTIVGEPGIGKSRLVAEFARCLADRRESVLLRSGRCLAYGDGVGFWPLAEIIKQHLGVSETASEDEARTLLTAAVEGIVDAPWLRTRLAPLVGLPGESGEREELFTAWRRFLDEVAARTPLVLVVEDLHWADPAMLAFVQHLAEWSADVPLLIVGTARPELFDRNEGWAGGLTNATTLGLRRLDDADVARLVDSLLGDFGSTDARSALVDRCGGNPLYAEEYARLLSEGVAPSGAAIPDTVQALIAARIDTLPRERKSLLHSAAVIGKVFWAGAVSHVDGCDAAHLRGHLHELARKELITRSRVSAVPDHEEYAFWHDLVHEVAYMQIPRTRRSDMHRRAAEWIETAAGDRLADRAEILAHHYARALDLADPADETRREELRQASVRCLTLAGEHAMGLDRERADSLLQSAAEIAIEADPQLPRTLRLLAECASWEGDPERARALLQESRAAAESLGDQLGVADALLGLLIAALIAGDRSSIDLLVEEGLAKIDSTAPVRPYAPFLMWSAASRFLADDFTRAADLIERALEYADMVDDEETAAVALNFRGSVRAQSGDRRGLDDLEASLRALEPLGSVYYPMTEYQVADQRLVWDGPVAAQPWFAAAIDHAHRIRAPSHEFWARGEDTWRLEDQGAWDEMLDAADAVIAWGEAHDSAQHILLAAPHKARVLALRGDTQRAQAVIEATIDRARSVEDPQVLTPTLAAAVLVTLIDGQVDAARELLAELRPSARNCWGPTPDICRSFIVCDRAADAASVIDGITAAPPRLLNAIPSVRATLAEAAGDHWAALGTYEQAAMGWRSYGHVYELAHALAGQARSLEALGRIDEADGPRAESEAIFARLRVKERIWPRAAVAEAPAAST